MSRPFPPTQKRLEKARADGKVLKSQLVTYFISILVITLVIKQCDPKTLLEIPCTVDLYEPSVCVKAALSRGCWVILSILAPCAFLLTGIEGLITGFKWKRAKKNFINPLSTMLSGIRSLPISILKSLPFTTILIFAVVDIKSMSPQQIEERGKVLLFSFIVTLLAVGIGELLWNRRKLFNELSMSFEEMREEMKDAEGDPFLKAERKALHRHLTFEQAVAKIRKSKVVIVE